MLLYLWRQSKHSILILSTISAVLCTTTVPSLNTNNYKCEPQSQGHRPYKLDSCLRLVRILARVDDPQANCTLVKQRGGYPHELECPYTESYRQCGLILDFPGAVDETRWDTLRHLTLVARELVARCEGYPGGMAIFPADELEPEKVIYMTILNLEIVGNGSGVLGDGMISEVLGAGERGSMMQGDYSPVDPVVE